jgi:hypothetical protein
LHVNAETGSPEESVRRSCADSPVGLPGTFVEKTRVVILDEEQKMIGIVTSMDIVRAVAAGRQFAVKTSDEYPGPVTAAASHG